MKWYHVVVIAILTILLAIVVGLGWYVLFLFVDVLMSRRGGLPGLQQEAKQLEPLVLACTPLG